MSAILPPTERLWWKHPLDRVEGTWIAIAFVWCMIMFFMMIFWHIYGKQNLSTETYRTTPELFAEKTQAMVDKYTVRTETEMETPVVAPPPGSDVYMIARLWNFWPILELQNGQTYKLHLTSMDYNHGFSLQPANINIQVVPGYEHVITVTPNQSGTYSVVCNEFCGIGHHTMVGRIYITGETGNVK